MLPDDERPASVRAAHGERRLPPVADGVDAVGEFLSVLVDACHIGPHFPGRVQTESLTPCDREGMAAGVVEPPVGQVGDLELGHVPAGLAPQSVRWFTGRLPFVSPSCPTRRMWSVSSPAAPGTPQTAHRSDARERRQRGQFTGSRSDRRQLGRGAARQSAPPSSTAWTTGVSRDALAARVT